MGALCTMRRDRFVARKCSPPSALAARYEDRLAPFVGESIEGLLEGQIGAPFSFASARVCKHVGPPFIARWLVRV
jgi:hypothetical protein